MAKRNPDNQKPDMTQCMWRLDENHQILPITAKSMVELMERTYNADEWDKEYRVAYDQFGEMSVSTVFLGIGMGVNGKPPALFETMVFGAGYEYQEKYMTWDEAVEGHRKWVDKLLDGEL